MISGNRIIADSGYWRGLFDPRDQYHASAVALDIDLDMVNVVVPWPSLFECLSTRFVKDYRRVAVMSAALRHRNVTRLDDAAYREDALAGALAPSANPRSYRSLSLVDRIIRLALEDSTLGLSAIVTFNARDFVDVCRSRQIEVLQVPMVD